MSMAKDEGSRDGIEFSFAGILKLKLPPVITQACFGSAAATAEKLQRLSANATDKIAAGMVPAPDEQLAHELVMAPLRRKAARLGLTVVRAAEILEHEPRLLPGYVEGQQVSQTPPAEDWTDRWVDGASTTDQPDVREMWARILAGEVTNPGSFSFKTLSVLKDIDTESALAFVRLLAFSLDDVGVPQWGHAITTAAYDKHDLLYPRFLVFEELGLLNFATQSTLPGNPLPCQGLAFGWRHDGTLLPGEITRAVRATSIHTLTRSAIQIASICDRHLDLEAARAVGNWFAHTHGDVTVTLPGDAKTHPWDPDKLTLSEEANRFSFG